MTLKELDYPVKIVCNTIDEKVKEGLTPFRGNK